MKTTIDIADDVLDRAKALASERRTTLKSLAEEGLRLVIERSSRDPVPYRPVVFGGTGPTAGMPDDFWDNVRDHAYEDEDGAA